MLGTIFCLWQLSASAAYSATTGSLIQVYAEDQSPAVKYLPNSVIKECSGY